MPKDFLNLLREHGLACQETLMQHLHIKMVKRTSSKERNIGSIVEQQWMMDTQKKYPKVLLVFQIMLTQHLFGVETEKYTSSKVSFEYLVKHV